MVKENRISRNKGKAKEEEIIWMTISDRFRHSGTFLATVGGFVCLLCFARMKGNEDWSWDKVICQYSPARSRGQGWLGQVSTVMDFEPHIGLIEGWEWLEASHRSANKRVLSLSSKVNLEKKVRFIILLHRDGTFHYSSARNGINHTPAMIAADAGATRFKRSTQSRWHSELHLESQEAELVWGFRGRGQNQSWMY